ncbi:sulfotransferase [Pseudogemmobacter sp. W21_MBD1_M6]|uniref:sulfotransferase n=1 Tax=Pseudogemmobacter sp. W21_MBD1_M6 TaxID=3240271 RepID=UPI003F9801DE
MSKTFVLGIGAPKAGTTWLHAYLTSMPGFARGFQKEFHIWDAVHVPEAARFRVRDGSPVLSVPQLLRREMQKYPSAYFDYFAALLGQVGATHAADITPSYCALSGEQISFIYRGLMSRGFNVRIVFLMRDPVERCWSMLRMFRADAGLQKVHSNLNYSKNDNDLLLDYALSDNARVRTRYDRTLSSLEESAVPAEHIHVGFYENMFSTSSLRALSDFLNVPFKPELSEKKVHVSPKTGEIEERVRAEVVRVFADVYRNVAKRMPEARTLWSGYEYVDGDGVRSS